MLYVYICCTTTIHVIHYTYITDTMSDNRMVQQFARFVNPAKIPCETKCAETLVYISHATCRCELSRVYFVSLAVLARRSGARRTRPTWKSNSMKGLSMPVRQSTSPHPINFKKAKNRLIVIILPLVSHSNCQIYVWIGRFTRDTNVLSSPWLERMTVDNNAGNFCF